MCRSTSGSCESPAKSRTGGIPRVALCQSTLEAAFVTCQRASNFPKLLSFGVRDRIGEYIYGGRDSIFSDCRVNGG